MAGNPIKLHLKRHIFETEGRVSKHEAEQLPNHVQKAVLAAMKIASFYENNPTDMIMPRDLTQILRQMGSQVVFTLELEGGGEHTIVAGGVLWDLEWPTVSEDQSINVEQFLEAGTQQCILNGFNLQWTINAVTLLRALAHDPSGTYFTATYGDNESSIANFESNMKFTAWPDIPSTVERWRVHDLEQHGKAHRGVRWFRPTVQTVVAAAERLVDFVDNPIRQAKDGKNPRHPVTGQVVNSIEFQCQGKFLDPIVQVARDICDAQPRTFSDLVQIEAIEDTPNYFIHE